MFEKQTSRNLNIAVHQMKHSSSWKICIISTDLWQHAITNKSIKWLIMPFVFSQLYCNLRRPNILNVIHFSGFCYWVAFIELLVGTNFAHYHLWCTIGRLFPIYVMGLFVAGKPLSIVTCVVSLSLFVIDQQFVGSDKRRVLQSHVISLACCGMHEYWFHGSLGIADDAGCCCWCTEHS